MTKSTVYWVRTDLHLTERGYADSKGITDLLKEVWTKESLEYRTRLSEEGLDNVAPVLELYPNHHSLHNNRRGFGLYGNEEVTYELLRQTLALRDQETGEKLGFPLPKDKEHVGKVLDFSNTHEDPVGYSGLIERLSDTFDIQVVEILKPHF